LPDDLNYSEKGTKKSCTSDTLAFEELISCLLVLLLLLLSVSDPADYKDPNIS
jgi:hypothetical protein